MQQQSIPRSVRRRVRRGAGQLDRFRPGWANRINIETLDIGNAERCITAQLEGHFCNYRRLEILGTATRNGMEPSTRAEADLATIMWKREIARRLASLQCVAA